jgi:hypothetical protein
MLSVGSILTAGQTQPAHPVLKTVREVRQLNNTEARNAYPVQLEGIATYSDAEWGLLFLNDETGAIYVNTHGLNTSFPPGSRIRVDAVTGPGDVGTVLVQPKVQVIGQGSLPNAEHKTIAELNALTADSRFVETHGVVWACDQNWKRICFRIVDGKSSALVVIPALNSVAAKKLVGSTVRLHGVSGIHLDASGKPVSAMLFVNRLEDIQVEGSSAQNTDALAVIVNRDNPTGNLTMAELREILLGRRQFWRGSQKIVLLLPNGGTPERTTALHLVDMNESSYKQYWTDRTSADSSNAAPASVPSSGIALSLVAESPGAIAVVPLADVRDSVKVVRIDGHLPNESGYPIH